MGFFSYLCKVCGLSVLNSTSVHGDLLSLSEVVALDYKNNVHEGHYDGYGNVGLNDIHTSYDKYPDVWHKFCYDGTTVYRSGSERCPDQGHFFNEEEFKAEMVKNKVFMTNYIKSLPDCLDTPEESDKHCDTCMCEAFKEERRIRAIMRIHEEAEEKFIDNMSNQHLVELIKSNGDLHEYHQLNPLQTAGVNISCDECDWKGVGID